MSTKSRAAILVEPNKPLVVDTVEIPDPAAGPGFGEALFQRCLSLAAPHDAPAAAAWSPSPCFARS